MAYRYYPDGNGDTFRVWDDDGRIETDGWAPWFPFSNLTSRPDDVLLCTYPRSGTHWVWEIIYMLLRKQSEATSVDMKTYNSDLAKVEDIEKMASPRVLATHRQFHDLPSDFIVNKTRLVLVLRDPRDVCVSHFNLLKGVKDVEYKGRFDGFTELFLQGKVPNNSWHRWLLSFEKGLKEHPDIPYHLIHYEQLYENPVSEIGRLAEFLGLETSLVNTVAEKTRFTNMKAAKSKSDTRYDGRFDTNSATDAYLRKGGTGDWKNWFTVDQEESFRKRMCQLLNRASWDTFL